MATHKQNQKFMIVTQVEFIINHKKETFTVSWNVHNDVKWRWAITVQGPKAVRTWYIKQAPTQTTAKRFVKKLLNDSYGKAN